MDASNAIYSDLGLDPQTVFDVSDVETFEMVLLKIRTWFGAVAIGYRLSAHFPIVLERVKRHEQLTSKFGWPKAFMEEWVQNGHSQTFDITQLHTSRAPVQSWTLNDTGQRFHGPMSSALDLMRTHGFASGISIMVPTSLAGYGSVILLYDKGSAAMAAETANCEPHLLYYVSNAVIRSAERLFSAPGVPDLSTYQLACLRWMKIGKTDMEIAEILQCSKDTVRYHLKGALESLNAVNRTHAVALAIEADLL